MAGDRLFAIAVSWWVVSKADLPERGLMLGLLLASSTLPIVLAGPFLGHVVDALSRRSCMVVADAVRLCIMAALGLLIHADALTLPLLFALCVPFFALEPLFSAAMSASLASLSQNPAMLARMVALERAIPNLGAVMGALLGSAALAAYGTEGAVWFNAGTFLLSCALVSRLPALRPEGAACQGGARRPGIGRTLLRQHPAALRLLFLFAAINFFITPVFLYLPLLVRDVLKGDGGQLGLLELAFSVGNLATFGYFLLRPRIFTRTRWLRFFLVAASALFLYILGSTDSLWVMLANLLAWGVSIAFVTYLAVSFFQRSIPEQLKGRFFAIMSSFCSLGFCLSFFCFGLLSSHFSLRQLIYSNVVGTLVVSLGFLSVPDEVRNAG